MNRNSFFYHSGLWFLCFVSLLSTSSINGQSTEIENRFSKADSLKQQQDFKNAASIYQRVFDLALRDEQLEYALKAKLLESECQWRLGSLEKAENANSRAKELIVLALHLKRPYYHKLLYNDGVIAYQRDDNKMAINKFRDAILWLRAQGINEKKWEFKLVRMLSQSFYYDGNLDSATFWAEHLYQRKKELFLNHTKDVYKVQLLDLKTNIGYLHLERGSYHSARESFKEAVEIQYSISQTSQVTSSPLVIYGSSLAFTGAVQEGIATVREGIDFMLKNETLYNPENIISIAILAETLIADKQFHEADSVVDEFIGRTSDSSNLLLVATGQYTKAWILYHHGELKESALCFQKTKDILTRINPTSIMVPFSFKKIIEIQFEMGKDSIANAILSEAKEFAKQVAGEKNANWFGLEIIQAQELIKNNQLNSAESVIAGIIKANALDIPGIDSKLFSDPWHQILSLKVLSKIKEKQGSKKNIDEGLKSLLEADSIVDNIRFSFHNFQDRMNLSDSINNLYDFSMTYCEDNYLDKDDVEKTHLMYHFLERGKSINLSQHLQNTEGGFSISADEEILIQELEKDLSHYISKIDKAKKNDTYHSLVSKISKSQSKIESVKKRLQEKSPYGTNRYINPPSPDKIKESLKEGEIAVSYSVGKDRIRAILMDRDKVWFQNLGASDTLESQIQRFIFQIKSQNIDSRNNLGEYKEMAYSLYQRLLAPVLNGSDYNKLIIIPSGTLYLLPFEALVSDKVGHSFGSLSYLIKTYEIQYAHSFTLYDYLNNKPSNFNNKVLALAPVFQGDSSPIYDLSTVERSDLAPIPNTRTEVERIGEYFDTEILIGNQATEESLRSNANSYGIIHLATHSLINDGEPLNSKILFEKDSSEESSDGLLHGYEIMRFDLNAEMVVLSACNTGLGKINKGEGALSIASCFFYAGANSVVMSLWPANDLSSSRVMAGFYESLSNGSSKSAALRKAKLDYLLDATEATSHPYYWSQYVFFGKDNPISNHKTTMQLSGISLVLVIILIAFFKRKSWPILTRFSKEASFSSRF